MDLARAGRTALLAAALIALGAGTPGRGSANPLAAGPRIGPDSVRVLVAYHSDTGNTRQLAEAAAEGARGVAGVAVALKPIADVTAADLERAAALIVGSPTHWANMAAPVKAFIDRWPDMVDKVGGALSTGGSSGGGHEQVLVSLVTAMLSHGMVVVGPVFEEGSFRFGSIGAGAVTGPADPGLSEQEREAARRLGRRAAELAARVFRPRER